MVPTSIKTSKEAVQALYLRLVNFLRETPPGSNMAPLLQQARITVKWKEQQLWEHRKRRGSARMIPTFAGFIVQMPKHCSPRWKNFVLGHELGHTLFFNPDDFMICDGESELAFQVHLRPTPDIWVPRDLKELLCDEVADLVLIPEIIVREALQNVPTRLEQVERIASECIVPVDRALRRRASVIGQSHACCVQLVVWQYHQKHNSVKALYQEGPARLKRQMLYGTKQAGLEWYFEPANEYPTPPNIVHISNVKLPNLRGHHNIEVLALSSEHFLVAYDSIEQTDKAIDLPYMLLNGG